MENFQLDLFGKKIKIKKRKPCQYCGKLLKIVDSRHLIHCLEYRKTLPIKQQKQYDFLDSFLKSTTLYLPKDISQISFPDGQEIPMFFIDGHFVTLMPFFSNICEESNQTLSKRWRTEKKKGMISYPKKITRKRLLELYECVPTIRTLPPASTYILLREDDMIYLASISSFKKTKLTLKYLIDFALKAKYWITDLIYKLGKCNNREFKFLCAWLRLGWALEEIEPQRWYRLPTTNRRVDFRLHNGELLVEIDAKEIEKHDPTRDKTTDQWFFLDGKLIIRFMNSQVDENPLAVVRKTIEIAKSHGIYIEQEVIPTFVKGFLVNKNNKTDQ